MTIEMSPLFAAMEEIGKQNDPSRVRRHCDKVSLRLQHQGGLRAHRGATHTPSLRQPIMCCYVGDAELQEPNLEDGRLFARTKWAA
jgi:hypothetical protein